MSDSHHSQAETGIDRPGQGAEEGLLIQQAINSILRISLEPISLDEQLHRVLELVLHLPWLALEAKGSIFLTEGDSLLVLKSHIGMPPEALSACSRVPFGTCICGRAIADNRFLFTCDVDERHDIRYPGMQPHGHYCVPLGAGGRRLGLLNLYVRAGHRQSPTEERFLRAAADALAGMIERQRAERAVRESEARKAAILETALDGIVTIDHEGRLVEFNPAAEKTFGFRRAQVLGRPMAELLVPPSLREQHHRGLARYLATGEGPVLNRLLEMPARRADGTEFPVEMAIARIATDGPPLFTAYLRDITERKALERRRAVRLAITQVLAEAATVEEAAARILQTVCEGLGWEVGCFWALDRRAGVLHCVECWPPPSTREGGFGKARCRDTFPPGVGLPGRIWDGGRPAWVADVTQEPDLPCAPLAAREGLRGAFGFPVRLGEETLGVMEFFSRQARGPDADLLEMLATVGGHIGQFLGRKQTERRLGVQHTVSSILARSGALDEAAPGILRAVGEGLDWDAAVLWVVDREANVLRCLDVWVAPALGGNALEQDSRPRTFAPGVGLPGRVWAGETLVWVRDLAADLDCPRASLAAGQGLHGAVGFPVRNGVEFLGVLELFSREVRPPEQELMEVMASIGSQISQFIERRQAESELRRQEQDRRIARQIQQGVLPRVMPRLPGLLVHGRSEPAQDVGGDCFDFVPLPAGGGECLGVVVADASGHGIGAALLAAQTRAYLRALALTCSDVAALLALTNRRLAGDLVPDHFVTLFLLSLDPCNRTLRYSSAGHCPGFVLDRRGSVRTVLASTGPPLGIDPGGEFPAGTAVTLGPGDLVFLYSDGITEATSTEEEQFGLKRALGVVRAHQSETPEQTLQALFDAVGDFSGHRPHDDLTAVIIQATDAAGEL